MKTQMWKPSVSLSDHKICNVSFSYQGQFAKNTLYLVQSNYDITAPSHSMIGLVTG